MSKERGRRKNYSSRVHEAKEFKRRKGQFDMDFAPEINSGISLIPEGDYTLKPNSTEIEPGKEYKIE